MDLVKKLKKRGGNSEFTSGILADAMMSHRNRNERGCDIADFGHASCKFKRRF